MNIDTRTTVGELASAIPGAMRVFDADGIDYCCGGKRTLVEACERAGVPVARVAAALESASMEKTEQGVDWRVRPLPDLVHHILEVHHTFTRSELERAGRLLDKVCAAHGDRHPEVLRLRPIFQALRDELDGHLMKEEVVLFPYVLELAEAAKQGRRASPPPFRTVQNPIAMMNMEHDSAGDALRQMRAETSGYAPPADACMSFRALYESLAALERDLHLHIHLESNVLFPRALEIERGGGSREAGLA